jgi:hypothetical protein
MLGTIHYQIRFKFLEYFKYLLGPMVCAIVLTGIHLSMVHYSVFVESFLKLIIMSVIALGIILLFHRDTLFTLYKTLRGK